MRSLLLLLFIASAFKLHSQAAGTLDTGFGTTGIVATGFGVSTSEAFAVRIQPDGKIVLAGNYTTGGDAKIAFVRLLANGTYDPAFGSNGRLQINTPSGPSIVRAIAILPNGSILGGGVLANKPMLVRITSAGVEDATFGNNGIVEFDGGLNGITDIKIDASGMIVGCGRLTTNPNALVVFRRKPDGSADNTFGTNGFAQVPTGGGLSTATRIALQGDKILVSGFFNSSGAIYKTATARLNSNGSLDNTFGTAGIFKTSFGNTNEYGDNMIVQSDNKILLCGRIFAGGSVQTLVYRLNENGTLDTSFGTNGKYNFSAGGSGDECTALAQQTDGKILVGGNTLVGNNRQAFIARLTKAGQKDTGFGTNGQTNVTSGQTAKFSNFALQPDNKIVAAGISTPGTVGVFSAFRFHSGSVVSNHDIPSTLTASAVYPNPALSNTTLSYSVTLNSADHATLALYSLDGRLVYSFVQMVHLKAGQNQTTLQLPAIAKGQYLLRVVGRGFTDTKPILIH